MTDSYYEHLFGVRDKVALVTGGTRGIGLMIAEGLVRCGAKVYIASRKVDACEEAQEKLQQFGSCIAIPADVATIEGCKQLANEIAVREDRLDILVNNAGVTWNLPLEEFHEKAWDKVMDLDLKSPFFLTQQLLPLLKKAASPEQRASVINISSINGMKVSGLKNYSYIAAKAGLAQLGTELASDLLADCINVNTIAPGMFRSKMTEPLFADAEQVKKVTDGIPMKTWGAMENAAGLTIFLSSKAGAYITGLEIPCDGGVTTIT